MKTVIVLATLLLSSSQQAGASTCDAWTAALEEDEGGPRMTAAVCAGANPDDQARFAVQCALEGEVYLRYLPASAINYPPDGDEGFTTTLKIAVDGKDHENKANFEGMDGAMAFATRIDAPLVDALKAGAKMSIGDRTGKVPVATFTLKGAANALKTLTDTCAR